MTEAGWTREKPTVAGWYWWRDVDKRGKVRFCVCQEVYMLRGSLFAADCGYLDKSRGEWLGPITPDSYQQGWEAGLREAIQRADELVDASGRRDIWAKKAIDRTLRISKYLCEEYALHPDGRPKRTVKKKQK